MVVIRVDHPLVRLSQPVPGPEQGQTAAAPGQAIVIMRVDSHVVRMRQPAPGPGPRQNPHSRVVVPPLMCST